MRTTKSSSLSLSPRALWNWGRLILIGGFVLGILLILYLAYNAPFLLFFIPPVVVGGIGVWYLFKHPLLNLCAVLAGFVLVVAHTEGINVLEVLYGLYFVVFIAHWFITRVLLYREHVFSGPEEKALLLFIIGITLTIPLSILYHANMRWVISEWTALLMILFYFPIKEALIRYPKAPLYILLVLFWIGLFVSLRNIYMYQQGLSNAAYAWQIARGREVMNDNLLMVLSVIALVFSVLTRNWRRIVPLIGVFLIILIGLILTQSRGNWLAFLLGAFAMFVATSSTHRKRMIVLGALGLTGVVVIGLVFFGDYVQLVFVGLIDRFASLRTAATTDISLVNRFRETAAAWEHIVQNPILGRGMGVPYTFFDLAHMSTDRDSFIHNGYVSLWYRFGLWGLLLILFVWIRSIWRGLKVYRDQNASLMLRQFGLAATCSLIALTLTTVTSNPLFLKDGIIMFAILFGIAGGAYERSQLDRIET